MSGVEPQGMRGGVRRAARRGAASRTGSRVAGDGVGAEPRQVGGRAR